MAPVAVLALGSSAALAPGRSPVMFSPFAIIWFLAIVLCTSCSTIAPVHTPERLHTVSFPTAPPSTTIDPGMLLEFRFFYQPELNDTQEVRADGAIALALIGEVKVAGLTPKQAQQRIRVLLAEQIANPDVTVIVRRATPTNVFVGGEVNAPGAVPFDVRLTVLEALMLAGGFNMDLANVRNVLVIRDGGDKRRGYAIDLQTELSGGDGAAFRLQPRDIVYVPRTAIADVNLWISQNINKVVPQLGASYSAPVGSGTAGFTTAIRR